MYGYLCRCAVLWPALAVVAVGCAAAAVDAGMSGGRGCAVLDEDGGPVQK